MPVSWWDWAKNSEFSLKLTIGEADLWVPWQQWPTCSTTLQQRDDMPLWIFPRTMMKVVVKNESHIWGKCTLSTISQLWRVSTRTLHTWAASDSIMAGKYYRVGGFEDKPKESRFRSRWQSSSFELEEKSTQSTDRVRGTHWRLGQADGWVINRHRVKNKLAGFQVLHDKAEAHECLWWHTVLYFYLQQVNIYPLAKYITTPSSGGIQLHQWKWIHEAVQLYQWLRFFVRRNLFGTMLHIEKSSQNVLNMDATVMQTRCGWPLPSIPHGQVIVDDVVHRSYSYFFRNRGLWMPLSTLTLSSSSSSSSSQSPSINACSFWKGWTECLA